VASFGGRLEIVDAPDVMARFYRIGAELMALYERQ
jgi:hypothetical protein